VVGIIVSVIGMFAALVSGVLFVIIAREKRMRPLKEIDTQTMISKGEDKIVPDDQK
jgi:hypothetical protein